MRSYTAGIKFLAVMTCFFMLWTMNACIPTGPQCRNQRDCPASQQCKAGWCQDSCPTGTNRPATEKCNNIDDNCDGQIDNATTDCGPGKTCAAGTCYLAYDDGDIRLNGTKGTHNDSLASGGWTVHSDHRTAAASYSNTRAKNGNLSIYIHADYTDDEYSINLSPPQFSTPQQSLQVDLDLLITATAGNGQVAVMLYNQQKKFIGLGFIASEPNNWQFVSNLVSQSTCGIKASKTDWYKLSLAYNNNTLTISIDNNQQCQKQIPSSFGGISRVEIFATSNNNLAGLITLYIDKFTIQ